MSTKITFIATEQAHMDSLRYQLAGYGTTEIKFDFKVKIIESIDDLKYDLIISPANSFGDLKGGIDMAYYRLLGREELAERSRTYVRFYADGEIHVGDYGIIPIFEAKQQPTYLALCPTMTVPGRLPPDSRNAYFYMRAVIKAIRKLKATIYVDKDLSMLCPIPCIGVGGLSHQLVAKQMRIAFESMNGNGIIHAINMSKKEEEDNTFGIPYYYHNEHMQNIKLAYIDTTRYP
jgi:O-acetyl-ADP-ribose deacetylase (regulator of RNase III)